MYLLNFISVTFINTYVKVVFRMKTVNWSRLGGLGLSVDHERRCEMQLVFYPLLSSIAFWTCFIYCCRQLHFGRVLSTVVVNCILDGFFYLLLIEFQVVFYLLLS